MMRFRPTLRWSTLPAALATLALAGCSMAGLPTLKPAPSKATPVAEIAPPPGAVTPPSEMALVVMEDAGVVPLAFAPEPRSAPGAGNVNALISKYAGLYRIPESLLHRVVRSESGYNPSARNGPYWGLMQILPATARSMGYSGPDNGLLDAETNLRYGAKYLRGAYLVAEYDQDRAVSLYRSGYYYHAKRAGLLEAVGLR